MDSSILFRYISSVCFSLSQITLKMKLSTQMSEWWSRQGNQELTGIKMQLNFLLKHYSLSTLVWSLTLTLPTKRYQVIDFVPLTNKLNFNLTHGNTTVLVHVQHSQQFWKTTSRCIQNDPTVINWPTAVWGFTGWYLTKYLQYIEQ